MADGGRSARGFRVGDELPAVVYPLSLYRLVMAAAATRDFNSIHHNSDHARATGAPEAYANTMFLQGMWERAVREFVGLEARILAIDGFRMRTFSPAGSTVLVRGRVLAAGAGTLELALWSEIDGTIVCGPGTVRVALSTAHYPTGQSGDRIRR
jgi:acyl dehydratase